MITHNFLKEQNPESVYILGGSGFLGVNLTKYLQGIGVAVHSSSSKEIDLTQSKSLELLPAKVPKSSVLVVLAAITPDRGKDSGALIKNIEMLHHLVQFMETAPPSHLIYVSSDAVYADNLNPVRETSVCEPGSLYGLSHRAREKILDEFSKRSGVPCLILRPTAMFGADDTHNSYGPNRFLRSAMRDGQIAFFGKGEEKRDHLFVTDMVHLLVKTILRRSSGVLNVATGTSYSFREVAEIIQELLERGIELKDTPRSNPLILHRHFDISALIKSFPEFRFTPIKDSLTSIISGIKSL